MSILKYTVVIVLAAIALGTMACGPSPNDKAFAIAGTLGQPGINALALVAPNPMHDKCLQSCAKSFPDKHSYQYRACARGC